MRTFQYKIEQHTGVLDESRLNNLGAEGWELVSVLVTKPSQDSTNVFRYFFKREREESADDRPFILETPKDIPKLD